jgi:hypothetical protein
VPVGGGNSTLDEFVHFRDERYGATLVGWYDADVAVVG